MIATKRIYESYDEADGYRVLVDRLWPRGVSTARAHVDLWAKALAPSAALRTWYAHDPAKWPEFRKRYRRELQSDSAAETLAELTKRARRGRVTLLYAARDGTMCNATVLAELLCGRGSRR